MNPMRIFRYVAPLFLVIFTALALSGHTSLSGDGENVPTDAGKIPSDCHFRGTGLYVLPDPKCSPGATNPDVNQGNINSTICKSGWTGTIRPPVSVTEPEKRIEFKAYGIHAPLHEYELDHIISLELGGAPNSYANYYPELNYPDAHGYYHNPKDHLENALRKRVCDGKMSLQEAQQAISTNWVAAYRMYG